MARELSDLLVYFFFYYFIPPPVHISRFLAQFNQELQLFGIEGKSPGRFVVCLIYDQVSECVRVCDFFQTGKY